VRRQSTKASTAMLQDIEKQNAFLYKGSGYKGDKMLDIFHALIAFKGTFFQTMTTHYWFVLEYVLYLALCICFRFVMDDLKDLNQAFFDDRIGVISTMATFSLGLYLSTCIRRWWGLRVNGVQKMWDANNNFAIRLSTLYVRYKAKCPRKVYNALKIIQSIERIQRYVQASLSLKFHKYEQSGFTWQELVERRVLSASEMERLSNQEGTLSETMWLWVMHEWTTLDECGLFDDTIAREQVRLNSMKEELWSSTYNGQNGAAHITAQMHCQLPFAYFHFASFIVKVNNIIQCLSISQDHNDDWVDNVMIILLILMVTCLYNGMLIAGEGIQCPFDNHFGCFPGILYEIRFGKDFENLFGFNLFGEERALVMQLQMDDTLKRDFEESSRDESDDEDDDDDGWR